MAEYTYEELLEAVERYGSKRSAAKALGLAKTTFNDRIKKGPVSTDSESPELPLYAGRVGSHKPTVKSLPKKGEIKRYIISCAQNNTYLEDKTIGVLETVAKFYQAEIIISSLTYNRSAFASASEKRNADHSAVGHDSDWYPSEIRNYLKDEDIQLAPTLMFAGRLNIMPTAARPLNGFESYTGAASCIIPHMRQHLKSVPTMKHTRTKMLYSTGTVTQRNYIERTAGHKADFHHTYGGLMVEVLHDGRWFVRHLNVSTDGYAYDLDKKFYHDGRVEENKKIAAVNWGDLHLHKVSKEVLKASTEIIDELKPEYQFFHDVLDFYARNHHHTNDHHIVFKKFHDNHDSVEEEIYDMVNKMKHFERKDTKRVVIESNHDQALTRWLKTTSHKTDPINAIFYLEAELNILKSIQDGKDFHALEWAFQRCGGPEDVYFLREDESFVILPEKNGGIECGIHGHRGANGSRGSVNQFTKLERRTNTGHTHSASMLDGNCCAGVSGDLDMQYNIGPSSWSHSHIITYESGSRAIITQWDSDWKA